MEPQYDEAALGALAPIVIAAGQLVMAVGQFVPAGCLSGHAAAAHSSA